MTLKEKLQNLPTSPGVYQHKDATGKVIYVGKAKNLRNRVKSYFVEQKHREARIQALIARIADIELLVTDTEAEALILENNLIKKLKPKYNVLLRDDKTYPFICIPNEPFPRLIVTRNPKKDGSRYFGPFTDVRGMNLLLETCRSLFQIRDCNLYLGNKQIQSGKYKACLQFYIKKCAAPCVGLQDSESYQSHIDYIISLLNGKVKPVVALLKAEMQMAAQDKRFEYAAEIRDRIKQLEAFDAKQKIVVTDQIDRDIFAFATDELIDTACGVVFKVRDGKIIGRQHHFIKPIADLQSSELIQLFAERYYAEAQFFPDEIFLPETPHDVELLTDFLAQEKGKKVQIVTPQRGDKADLVKMTEANARLLLDEYKLGLMKREADFIPKTLQQLQKDLQLPRLPRRIECFDISHLGGTGTVASCVVFIDGKPAKSEYRKFIIQSVDGKPDDFASMHEVITRRFKRVMAQNDAIPDLIIIDGGKGQLSSAIEAMKQIDYYGKSPVVGLAKRLEEIFFPNDKDAITLPKISPSLRLLQQTRDEAHRFAVTFQREQRKKKDLHSELMEIKGIGEKTVQKLLKHFGSVKKIKSAEIEEIEKLAGKNVATKIFQWKSASK